MSGTPFKSTMDTNINGGATLNSDTNQQTSPGGQKGEIPSFSVKSQLVSPPPNTAISSKVYWSVCSKYDAWCRAYMYICQHHRWKSWNKCTGVRQRVPLGLPDCTPDSGVLAQV